MIITIAEIVQTIPSLALLALLMIIFGLGNLTMGIALVPYALLPIIRNTQVALTELPPAIIDAARGMGMSRSQRLTQVEIPLAIPMIFGGIKVALVNSLSIAVMGVLIGSGASATSSIVESSNATSPGFSSAPSRSSSSPSSSTGR